MPIDPNLILFQINSAISKFPYWRYLLIGFLVFLLLFVFGKERHLIFRSHKRGAIFGFIFGVLLILFLDAVVILGIADRSKLKDLLFGKEQRQALVGEVIYSGLNNLNNVLGVSTFIAPKKAKNAEEVIHYFLSLPDNEALKVKKTLCP